MMKELEKYSKTKTMIEEQIASFDENDLFDTEPIFEYVASDVEGAMSEYFSVRNVQVKDHRTETRLVTSPISKELYIAEVVAVDKKKGQYFQVYGGLKEKVSVEYVKALLEQVE